MEPNGGTNSIPHVPDPRLQRFAMVDSGRRADRTFAELAPPVLRLEHRLLKQPAVVPLGGVACVIRQRDVDHTKLVLHRDPDFVKLSAKTLDANVVLVLDRPATIGPFKSGAEQTLPITAKVRRKGLVVEVVFLTVEDPDALVEGLALAGVRVGSSLRDELVAAFGEASPDLAAVKVEEARHRARRAQLKFGLIILALTIGFSARISFDSEDSSFDGRRFVLQLVVAALIVAAACGIALRWPVRAAELNRPISDRPKPNPLLKWAPLIVLAVMALVFGLAVFAIRVIGLPGYLAFGPIVALPACAMAVPFILNVRRARATADAVEAKAADAGPAGPDGPGAGSGPATGYPPSPFRR